MKVNVSIVHLFTPLSHFVVVEDCWLEAARAGREYQSVVVVQATAWVEKYVSDETKKTKKKSRAVIRTKIIETLVSSSPTFF